RSQCPQLLRSIGYQEVALMFVNRREFLKSAATAIAGGLGAARLLWAEDKANSAGGFNGFTVGVQSYTFRKFKLEPALKKIQELGLHYVEFYNGHVPLDAKPQTIGAVKKLCADYGIIPIAFGVEGFSKNHDANKRKFEFAKALGIKHLSADPD